MTDSTVTLQNSHLRQMRHTQDLGDSAMWTLTAALRLWTQLRLYKWLLLSPELMLLAQLRLKADMASTRLLRFKLSCHPP